ncbi:MAG TPA: hypothetical protein ENG48_11220 [Candidatus Atribacteria bacterium]|nr:hypothetical protein [Candidatus Atribacteria bacterium]
MAGLGWLRNIIDIPIKLKLHDEEAFNIKNATGRTILNVDTKNNRVTGAIQTYNGQMALLNPEVINLTGGVYSKIEGTWLVDEGINFELDPLQHIITYTGQTKVDLLFLGSAGVELSNADTLTLSLNKNNVRQEHLKTIVDFTSASKYGYLGVSGILRSILPGDTFYVSARTTSNNTLSLAMFNISFITLGSATI